jgi:hypothetical protein
MLHDVSALLSSGAISHVSSPLLDLRVEIPGVLLSPPLKRRAVGALTGHSAQTIFLVVSVALSELIDDALCPSCVLMIFCSQSLQQFSICSTIGQDV